MYFIQPFGEIICRLLLLIWDVISLMLRRKNQALNIPSSLHLRSRSSAGLEHRSYKNMLLKKHSFLAKTLGKAGVRSSNLRGIIDSFCSLFRESPNFKKRRQRGKIKQIERFIYITCYYVIWK